MNSSALFTRSSAIVDVLHAIGESTAPLCDLNGRHRNVTLPQPPDRVKTLTGDGECVGQVEGKDAPGTIVSITVGDGGSESFVVSAVHECGSLGVQGCRLGMYD
ncbi:hypothetical protein ACIRQH_14705 [Streptomyces sp. NPDC102279]|uniref:hypothetical protein n=1 Tax=Streptomyces sp. NPDC102279 TaxID=3366153 RepID=UPI0037FF8DBD